MIPLLRNRKILTSKLLPEPFRPREFLDKRDLHTYLSEIPANFMSFITGREKANRVRQHLTKIYGRVPTIADVDIVTRRLVNLAHASMHSRNEIEDRLRQAQFKHEQWNQVGRCEVCGFQFVDSNSATVDHILPLSLGGEDSEINWQLLCTTCNSQKGRRFGCSDIARSQFVMNAHFFNQPLSTQIQSLLNANWPLRYEVFELMSRRCENCKKTARERKLFVRLISEETMVSVDNLTVNCEECVTKLNAKYRVK
jgi:5-methylcytosine-specific restriction endonuclease McrA